MASASSAPRRVHTDVNFAVRPSVRLSVCPSVRPSWLHESQLGRTPSHDITIATAAARYLHPVAASASTAVCGIVKFRSANKPHFRCLIRMKPSTHRRRRRDSTRLLGRVGVGRVLAIGQGSKTTLFFAVYIIIYAKKLLF